MNNSLIWGTPVIIATDTFQRRKHRKKRINKKWLKRYGKAEINKMPHDQVVAFNGAIYMTQRTFEKIFDAESEGKNGQCGCNKRSSM